MSPETEPLGVRNVELAIAVHSQCLIQCWVSVVGSTKCNNEVIVKSSPFALQSQHFRKTEERGPEAPIHSCA